jgi:hypothetical protein
MKTRGPYTGKNGPRGLLVHSTAGRFNKGDESAFKTIDGGIKGGLAFLCTSQTGAIVQAHDVNSWGYHSGSESAWPVKLKRLVWKIVGRADDDIIGNEHNCAGLLTKVGDKYYPYWAFKDKNPSTKIIVDHDEDIPEENVRFVTKELHGCPTGYYHKFTPQQEDTLIRTIMWLYVNCPDFKLEYVLGHHEVSGVPGIGYWRKNDPGGALSMSMENFRKYLIDNKHALIEKYGIKKERG